MWVITRGEEQVYEIIGPFDTEAEAEEFIRKHNLYAWTMELTDPKDWKAVY